MNLIESFNIYYKYSNDHDDPLWEYFCERTLFWYSIFNKSDIIEHFEEIPYWDF